MSVIQIVATEALTSLALGVISLLGAYALYFISKSVAKIKVETSKISDEAQRTLFENALADVANLVSTTVSALEQTTASALRDAVKDGKVDREELLSLGETAFNSIKARTGIAAQVVIAENLGSFDGYLNNLIESKVLELKTNTSVVYGEPLLITAPDPGQ